MILLTSALAASQIAVASPDDRVSIAVASDGGSYSVTRKGEQILAASPLGLELADGGDFSGLELVDVTRQSGRRELLLIATKASSAGDWYNRATIRFRERAGARRSITLELRAYDDGVAFRYLLPKGAPVALRGEKTGFRFVGDPTCEFTEYSGSHENAFQTLKISQLDKAKRYDVPVLCASVSGRTHFAFAQAGIEAYAGSSLTPLPEGLQVKVTPRPDRPEAAVLSPDGLRSAWRVVMLGDRAGDLIESTLIQSLSPPPKGDFAWVKPGKAAWDWWSGPIVGEKPTMERYRRFIVLARRKGRSWYIGAMTNEEGRDIEIPLRILGAGKYRATIWQDGTSANDVVRTTTDATRRDSLSIRMRPGGGAAVLLEPVR